MNPPYYEISMRSIIHDCRMEYTQNGKFICKQMKALLSKRKDEIALLTFFPPGCLSAKLIPRRLLQTIKESFTFEIFSIHCTAGNTSIHLLILSKDVWVSVMVFLKALNLFTHLSRGLCIKLGNSLLCDKDPQ